VASTPATALAARFARQLAARLRDCGTPQRAAGAKAYLKSDLRFFGVDTPTLRRELRRLAEGLPEPDRELLLALAEQLWRQPIFELRAAAAEVLTWHVDLLGPRDLAILERYLRDSRTWALVDALAPQVAGPIVERHRGARQVTAILERWAADEDFWLRRAALLVHLLPLRRGGGDFAAFARHADRMLEEREFFIRKAIGWVLREVGKRRPELVTRWLLPRARRAAGLTVREAVKYLPAADRQAILAARAAA
jgi:3-methyladenine DNA glycosylase AlkD